MAEKQEFWTEARLKKGITWLVIGIVVVLAGMGGYWYYLNRPQTGVPTIVQKSIDQAQADIKKDPKSVNARLNLANIYLQSAMYDDAMSEAQAALKIQKDNEFAIAVEAMVYNSKGNLAMATTLYKKAIELSEKQGNPGRSAAFTESVFRLGKIYMQQKKYGDAVALFQQSVNFNPIDSDALYQLGNAYLYKGDNDNAIKYLTKAVAYVPNYYDAQYALGRAYEKKGDKANAIKAYQLAVKYKSDFKAAKDALDHLQK